MVEENKILECDFAFKCPRKWADLVKRDEPNVRYCDICEREVFYAFTRDEFEYHKSLDRCIAANVYEPEVFGYTGMMGEPDLWGKQVKDKTEPFVLKTKKLLILGTDENKNEVENALKKMKRKKWQKWS
jgi:lipoate synthase